jgi:hypothetical protein
MARPISEYRTKRNGAQLQVYRSGQYLGSISFPELCRIITNRSNSGTGEVTAR